MNAAPPALPPAPAPPVAAAPDPFSAGSLARDFVRQFLMTAAVSVTVGLLVERWRKKPAAASAGRVFVVVDEHGEILGEIEGEDE